MDHNLVGSFGTCIWHPDYGMDLISEGDQESFPQLTTAIFECTKEGSEWLEIEYGKDRFCVARLLFKPVPSPKFKLNDNVIVVAKNRNGTVSSLAWHLKNKKAIYFISFDGKRSSRRYSAEELAWPE